MAQTTKKIIVAMSGGVDSSVAAALLQQEGHDVEGAFIVPWSPPWLPCTWRDERLDAMRVAAHLRIPFRTVDLSTEYEQEVVRYLVEEYRRGRTPNPDVMCNKYIKFGAFFTWAMQQGYDMVATGHYARVTSDHTDEGEPALQPNNYQLRTGEDAQKDQSYFLWTLTQHHLAHTLFPVGVFEKPKVRDLAEKFGLPTAKKKDSQGVCFLGKIDMKEFLQHYIAAEEGVVLDLEGHGIGTHDGAMFVTLGQRHGFQVHAHAPNAAPLYVVAKDVVTNTVTVAPRNEGEENDTARMVRSVRLSETNWISGAPAASDGTQGSRYAARFRYRQSLFQVEVQEIDGSYATVVFLEPQQYVPVGQSLVLYENDRCVGGGLIEQVVHSG